MHLANIKYLFLGHMGSMHVSMWILVPPPQLTQGILMEKCVSIRVIGSNQLWQKINTNSNNWLFIDPYNYLFWYYHQIVLNLQFIIISDDRRMCVLTPTTHMCGFSELRTQKMIYLTQIYPSYPWPELNSPGLFLRIKIDYKQMP